ncbi:gamma-mobile-trio integrase GmtZ, partial [Enterovibrio norvegicus]
ITSRKEYQARYKEDPRLPSNPNLMYKKEWMDWADFLGQKDRFYPDLQTASEAAQHLKITSRKEYQARYKKDPRLPSNPYEMYKKEWTDWDDFLLPKTVSDVWSFKQACSVLGINNSRDYRHARKKHKLLPAKPEKLVWWIDWYNALDIPRPYEYGILRGKVLEFGCQTLNDYKKMRLSLNDPRVPSAPAETYSEWTNTHDFFGKKRPYKVRYFEPEWEAWGLLIKEFLKTARAGDTKEKDLCEFVREFIEPSGYGLSPLDFLTRGSVDIHPMLALFSEVPSTRKKKWLFSINEFLDWVLATELTIEDEDTGEIHLVNGARNPFALINFDGEITPEKRGETDKLALPYQFVKATREWIFPDSSLQSTTNYNELSHLHRFSADWITVDDPSLIDENDPDCVVRRNGDKVEIWLPIYWTYTFALMHLPARGRQIIYCDSGEADGEVARIENGKVIWAENKNKLTGLTECQAMVSKIGEDYGVRYTSNKTHFGGQGYRVPFIPDELVYWLIKLRNWQEKYNPISKPTAWFDCKRTNLNESQRKQKGSNCFLFRDVGEVEPGIFGSRLTNRLAAALFFSGKGDVSGTTYFGLPYKDTSEDTLFGFGSLSISQFNSSYTPHSLRVSLINAYAYEFGLPLEVIMKLVGHSSILMSIYYIKSDKTGANLRERLEKGEKEALRNVAYTLKKHIENQRIEECKSQLTANSPEFLTSLTNARPSSSYQFKDFGCCPVGGVFCSEGGDRAMTKVNIFHPVPAGYLGEQNCIRCRFFVTGPAFMMGLVALFNEISLSVHTQSLRHSKLEEDLDNIIEDIEVISHQIYEEKKNNSEMQLLQEKMQAKVAERHKLNSEIETRAKKIDLYLCDMNFVHKHIDDCRTLAKSHPISPNKKLQLVVPASFEVSMDLDDVSCFHQLSEVCENAEIYHSCSDEIAIHQRSQILDRMLINNQIEPKLMFLSEQEQLSVGNQLTELMLSRLKSWENVDKVIDGSLLLTDLDDRSRSTLRSINQLFSAPNLLKIGGQSE